jgi:hypothetical protein
MTEQRNDYPDPLIDEVRQRRRELFAECGYDLNKLFELIRKIQAEHPEKVIDLRKKRREVPPDTSQP